MNKRGLLVKSFGSGQQVKLPGTSLDKPNVYTFDTTYEYMYKDLYNKDANLSVHSPRSPSFSVWTALLSFRYTQNGVLHMLDRNRRIKEKPERFQDCRERFDVIFTVEERIFDQAMEGEWKQITLNQTLYYSSRLDLESRDKRTNEIVHVINIDVVDNPEDATLGAFMICELAQKVNERMVKNLDGIIFVLDGRSCWFGQHDR